MRHLFAISLFNVVHIAVTLELAQRRVQPLGGTKPGSQAVWLQQIKDKATAASCRPTRPDDPNAKRVLVTGTGGFIGMSTAQALRRRGDGVLGLDNFNDYYPVVLKRARAKHLQDEGVVTLEADLNDRDALEQAFALCNFTHVLHLAAQAGVRYATVNPGSYVQSNVAGFVSVLEVVRNRNPKPPVVYASSSSVYGMNTKTPFSEADPVDLPASLYAATKREDELLARTYNHIYGMALTGLRFFTVYGPWGRPDMALFSFANKIKNGTKITIFQGPGGSELERDFTYIDDIVQGCVKSVDHIGPSVNPKTGKAPLKVYNLGNTQPETVSHLVDLLEESLGKKAVRKYIPMPETGDVLKTFADISLAKKELGYEPKTSLRDGIQKFVGWYNEQFKDGLDPALAAYKPL